MASAVKGIPLDNDSVIYEHIIPRSVRQKWIRRASIDHLDLEVTSPRGRVRSKENVFEEKIKPKKKESEKAENDFGDSIVSHDVQDLVNNENILDGKDIGLITPEEEKAVFDAWGVKLRHVGKNNEIKLRPGSFHESNLIKIDPSSVKEVSPSLQKPPKDKTFDTSSSIAENKGTIVKLRENYRRPRPKSLPAMTQEMENDYKNSFENNSTSRSKPKAYISPHAKVPWKRFMKAKTSNDLIIDKEKVTESKLYQKQNDNNIPKDYQVRESRLVEKTVDKTKKEIVANNFDEEPEESDQPKENQFDIAQKQNTNNDMISTESDNKDSGTMSVLLSVFERMKSFENIDKHKKEQGKELKKVKKGEASTKSEKISKVNNDPLQGIKKIDMVTKTAENVTIKTNVSESENSGKEHEESVKESSAIVVPFVKQIGFVEEKNGVSFDKGGDDKKPDIKTDIPSSNLTMMEEMKNHDQKLGSISDSGNKNDISGNSHQTLLDIFQCGPVSKEGTNQENAYKEAMLPKQKVGYDKNQDEEKLDSSAIDKSIVFTALKTYEKKINKLVIQTGEQREKQLKSRKNNISSIKRAEDERVEDTESNSKKQELQNGSILAKKTNLSGEKEAKENNFVHGEAKEKRNGKSIKDKTILQNGNHETAEKEIQVDEIAKAKSVIPVTNIDDLTPLPKESIKNIPVTNLDEPSVPVTNGLVLPSSLKRENQQANKSESKIVIPPKKKPGKYDADRRALVAPKVFFENPVTGLKSSLSPKGKKKAKVISLHILGTFLKV